MLLWHKTCEGLGWNGKNLCRIVELNATPNSDFEERLEEKDLARVL